MPALGLVLVWGGYWLLAYGLALRKGAQVGLTDMALPSRREATLAAVRAAYASPSSSGSSSSKKSGPVSGPLIPYLPPVGPKIKLPGGKYIQA